MDAVDIIRVERNLRVVAGLGCCLLDPVGIRCGSNVIRFLSASALCQAVYRFKSFFRAVLMVASLTRLFTAHATSKYTRRAGPLAPSLLTISITLIIPASSR